ncbi:hypothetical protein C8F01DRAFT_1052392 [Mycena amicta]|nr:hypothetical protein C8F01DRAFT_1052392 [Mycena amicta]
MACVAGLGILDKYYAKTDDSIMYRLAMLMHPSYGLAYFDKMGWPKEWKDIAVDLARTQWTENYRVQASSTGSAVEPTAHCTLFDELDVTPITTDPFEHFIASLPIPKAHCQQPLVWFGTISPYASDPTPNNKALIRMAQDFLGAPGKWCCARVCSCLTIFAATSVDVERAFSHGGGMVTKRRHALSAETIRANALVSAWQRDGLVPEEEAVKVLGALHSRKKKAKVIELGSDGESEADADAED